MAAAGTLPCGRPQCCLPSPPQQVQTYGQFRIGMCHGHQIVPVGDRAAAAILQRKLNTDILVLGHTHAFQAYKHEGRFVINPGSGTGAFSTITPDPIPSFVLMDIDGPRVSSGWGGMCWGGAEKLKEPCSWSVPAQVMPASFSCR